MKRFISGFLFGALLFAVPTLANNSKTVEAFYNNIKLSVYGQIVDTEGNEPFIVGGRTYVPARYVAEAMGGVVKWNETENTVEVIPSSPETTPEPNKLTSDGLEAKYIRATSSCPEGYYIKIKALSDFYSGRLSFDTYDNDNTFIWNINNPSSKVLVTSYNISGFLQIPLDEYENKIIPLFYSK